jgi:hypothetical protein
MSQFRRPFIVNRITPGHVIDGFWVEGTSSQITIMASLQALKPEEMKILVEGRRETSVYYLFTETKLYTVTDANPDIVIINTDEYEVNKEEAWQNGVINHFKYMVTRKLK